jgi:hypothetical protein
MQMFHVKGTGDEEAAGYGATLAVTDSQYFMGPL